MFRSLATICCTLLLTACLPVSIPASPSPHPIGSDEFVDLPLSNITIKIRRLPGWSLYNDAEHIVLTEEITPLDPEGVLHGIVIHLWVAEMTADGTIVEALHHILQTSDIGDDAVYSEPQAFEWQQHESAYYLLNTHNDNVALVLVVRLPESPQMLAINITTSLDDHARIRKLLPELFMGFMINNHPLSHHDLYHIPESLDFPTLPQQPATQETTEAMTNS